MKTFRTFTLCLAAALSMKSGLAQTYVYVLIPGTGTYAYDVSSDGKLASIKGSPFPTAPQRAGGVAGTNGSFYVTYGDRVATEEHLFSYEVLSNGAIGKLVSKINPGLYSGSVCGPMSSAELDHTGSFVYTLIQSGLDGECNAFQTFQISKTGELTFKGSTNTDTTNWNGDNFSLPSVTRNERFGYSLSGAGGSFCCEFNFFSRESTGVLNLFDGSETDPVSESGPSNPYLPGSNPTSDSTNHLAIVLGVEFGPGSGQLASYTVDSQGNISSTNTWENMPSLASPVNDMKLDPTGKILAVATGTGVQFFHFNEASPITAFTGVIGTSGFVNEVAWDSHGHLYAQNGASGRMHIYAVTSTSVKEMPGSPTVIENNQGLFVVRSK